MTQEMYSGDVIYRICLPQKLQVFRKDQKPIISEWYSSPNSLGGLRGCFDTLSLAKRAARTKHYEIWMFHVGISSTYFEPKKVFEK